jgi:hypothetical protein
MKGILPKIIFMLAVAFSSLTYAALNDAFSDAFSNATVQTGGTGTFELNGRTLHSAGYVRIRIPVVAAPNPIRAQAPGIKGGCNGFDIYGGSFSYISEDEILDWFNAVIENAGALTTYMFITYLQEQCSVCSEVMQTLYAMQDMLNMTMQDSCSTATAMVDGLQGALSGDPTPSWDAYAEGVKKSALNFSDEIAGNYDDAVAALAVAEQAVGTVAKAVMPDDNQRQKEFYGGNMLYWIVEESDALATFRALLSNTTLSKEQLYTYLVAIVGNQVDFVDETVTSETQTTKIGSYTSNVTISDFITSAYVNNTVPSKCDAWPSTNFCRAPTDELVKDGFANVEPFVDTFSCVMKGEDSKGASCGSGVGLIGKLGRMKDDVGELTTEEAEFIRDFLPGFNFGAMLVELSSSPAAMSQFYDCTSESIINGFAYHQISTALHAVRKMLQLTDFGSGKGLARKSAFIQQLDKRTAALNSEFNDLQKNIKGSSNCNDKSINTFLDLKKYSEGVN